MSEKEPIKEEFTPIGNCNRLLRYNNEMLVALNDQKDGLLRALHRINQQIHTIESDSTQLRQQVNELSLKPQPVIRDENHLWEDWEEL